MNWPTAVTLMLHKVGDIPQELQPKLLRVLQAREIERLGGHKVISVAVCLGRLPTATCRDWRFQQVAAISQRKQEASAPPAPAQPIRPVYTDAHHQPDETLSKRDHIVAAILDCNGAMTGSRGVPAMLGLKRTTMLSRMQRMGIDIKHVLETRGQSLPP